MNYTFRYGMFLTVMLVCSMGTVVGASMSPDTFLNWTNDDDIEIGTFKYSAGRNFPEFSYDFDEGTTKDFIEKLKKQNFESSIKRAILSDVMKFLAKGGNQGAFGRQAAGLNDALVTKLLPLVTTAQSGAASSSSTGGKTAFQLRAEELAAAQAADKAKQALGKTPPALSQQQQQRADERLSRNNIPLSPRSDSSSSSTPRSASADVYVPVAKRIVDHVAQSAQDVVSLAIRKKMTNITSAFLLENNFFVKIDETADNLGYAVGYFQSCLDRARG